MLAAADALQNLCSFVNGADWIGDIEGKAAEGSGERVGRRASFKFVFMGGCAVGSAVPSGKGHVTWQLPKRLR